MFNRNKLDGRHKDYDMVDNRYRDRYDLDNRKPKKKREESTSFAIYWLYLFIALVVGLIITFLIQKVGDGIAGIRLGGGGPHQVSAQFAPFHTWQYYAIMFGLLAATLVILYLTFLFINYGKKVALDTSDINQHEDDMQIMLPEALPSEYDIFPDAGATSNKNVTAILSHMHLSNSGLAKVEMVKRYKKDIYDEDGDLIHHYQDPIIDDDGYYETETLPMIDTKLSDDLFDASFMFDKSKKIRFDARKLIYRKENKDETRLSKFKGKTVADEINENWEIPEYELQRPAGMYIVDTSPTNTLIAAITRGYKGQCVIEPTIDCLSRCKIKSNIIANDPKGELYVKFYYRLCKRGFEVVAFNLMNDSKTNVYNPLMYAVNAARHGEYQKAVMLVKNIGNIFFPVEGADEPMWPNAANNSFQRCALGLIEYYLEQENRLLEKAKNLKWSPLRINRELDNLWGHVSLYNVYQFMTKLSSMKTSNPEILSLDPIEGEMSEGDKKKRMASKDLLTLYFEALEKLPANSLRRAVIDVHNSLKAMAGSDKTISCIYGIALVGLAFFTDEKIARLTSGLPSQNFDIDALSFPRRLEIHFSKYYMEKASICDQRFKWTIYHDKNFKNRYEGLDYEYTGVVRASGWVDCVFKGILEEDVTYFKLEIFEMSSKNLMKTFYFRFTKSYQVSSDGRHFIEHPVLKERIVKDGSLVELEYNNTTKRFEVGGLTLNRQFRDLTNPKFSRFSRKVYAIDNTVCHYVECPKAIFLVTPPNMFEYAKIPLIIVDQIFDTSVGNAYTLSSEQKPFYGNKYIIDELGNFQSGGNGIPYLNTKVSIGLGQDQQFTLVVQVIQQFQDVYGATSDRTLQSNLGNILFLRSNDSEMLTTFSQMSGTIHRGYTDQRSVTKDSLNLINAVGTAVSDTLSLQEQPVITINDMLSIPKCNMIVFGHPSTIWSRNETVLPVAWRLHQLRPHDTDTVVYDEKGRMSEYTLFEVPSISNTNDYNRLGMIPDFEQILAERVVEARYSDEIIEKYKKAYNLNDLNTVDADEAAYEMMFNLRKIVDNKNDVTRILNALRNRDDVEKNEEIYEADDVKLAQASHDLNNCTVFGQTSVKDIKLYLSGQQVPDNLQIALSRTVYDNRFISGGLPMGFTRDTQSDDITKDGIIMFENQNNKIVDESQRKENDELAEKINNKMNGNLTGSDTAKYDKNNMYEATKQFWRELCNIIDKTQSNSDNIELEIQQNIRHVLGIKFYETLIKNYDQLVNRQIEGKIDIAS